MTERSKMKHFDGQRINVAWDAKLCIHVGECVRAKGDLFVAKRDPWCEPDAMSVSAVAEIVERCPSGALSYDSDDDSVTETPVDHNSVVVSNNGPLYLRGDLNIAGANDDMQGVRFRAALCRCGLSKNKPFCDNSHVPGKFSDSGAVGDIDGSKPREEAEEAGGRLEIKPQEDGPLQLNGVFSLLASSGRTAWRGTDATLCRCGQSNNKPFCDGSHKEAGFKANGYGG